MGWARLYGLFDWFVPAALRSDQDAHRRARMFVIAHVLGTPLGFPIVTYLHWLDPGPQSAASDITVMIAIRRSCASRASSRAWRSSPGSI